MVVGIAQANQVPDSGHRIDWDAARKLFQPGLWDIQKRWIASLGNGRVMVLELGPRERSDKLKAEVVYSYGNGKADSFYGTGIVTHARKEGGGLVGRITLILDFKPVERFRFRTSNKTLTLEPLDLSLSAFSASKITFQFSGPNTRLSTIP